MLASSIQAELDILTEPQKAGEDLLFDYGRENGADVLIYRFLMCLGSGADQTIIVLLQHSVIILLIICQLR